MARFDAKNLDKWVQQSQVRMDAVIKQSAQDVARIANEPRAKGGNMPVDTGFLRNSIGASTRGMPGTASDVAAIVLQWQPAQSPMYIGWTAQYSRAMERKYAFMRLAAQQWQEIVDSNARKLRSMRDGS